MKKFLNKLDKWVFKIFGTFLYPPNKQGKENKYEELKKKYGSKE